MSWQVRRVGQCLGWTLVAGTLLALAHRSKIGWRVGSVERLAGVVAPGGWEFKYRLLSKATLMRRKKSVEQRLTAEEGNRLARLAKVVSFALDVYKDQAKARGFLTRPHPMLDGRPPLDVALATGPGADTVINILGRAAYGGRSEEHTSELQSLMR